MLAGSWPSFKHPLRDIYLIYHKFTNFDPWLISHKAVGESIPLNAHDAYKLQYNGNSLVFRTNKTLHGKNAIALNNDILLDL